MKSALDAHGTVHVSGGSIPVSDFASEEANKEFRRMRMQPPPYYQAFEGDDVGGIGVDYQRRGPKPCRHSSGPRRV